MSRERARLERASARADERAAQELVRELADGVADASLEDGVSALVAEAKAGDPRARERLIERLVPLVAAQARRYRTAGLETIDLVQEGIVGLLRALERYDPGRGVPFPTFAVWWIRHALQEARSDFIRPLRLPPRALRQLARLKSEHQRIYQAEHRRAELAELAERTSIDLAQAQALVSADARARSLDEIVEGHEGEVGTLGDLLEDPLSAAAYEEVIDAVAGRQLRVLLSRLTDREREIVRARFGFDGPAQKLAEIGEQLGLSAERVRQLEERALAKLRHAS